ERRTHTDGQGEQGEKNFRILIREPRLFGSSFANQKPEINNPFILSTLSIHVNSPVVDLKKHD
ncbi:MAG TPA: hypothetical protein VF611_15695, partial [Pyrinomonadaceae bacterium]